jgi:hypothetical protein
MRDSIAKQLADGLLRRDRYSLTDTITGNRIFSSSPTELDHVANVYYGLLEDYNDPSADPSSLTDSERRLLTELLDGPDSCEEWGDTVTPAQHTAVTTNLDALTDYLRLMR